MNSGELQPAWAEDVIVRNFEWRDAPFSELVGKTIQECSGLKVGSEEVLLLCSDGTKYRQKHWQDCCESVQVEDVAGDVSDLIGREVLMAEESSSDVERSEYGTGTWTFYRVTTSAGLLVVRWLGTSNGYYSEQVDFEKEVEV